MRSVRGRNIHKTMTLANCVYYIQPLCERILFLFYHTEWIECVKRLRSLRSHATFSSSSSFITIRASYNTKFHKTACLHGFFEREHQYQLDGLARMPYAINILVLRICENSIKTFLSVKIKARKEETTYNQISSWWVLNNLLAKTRLNGTLLMLELSIQNVYALCKNQFNWFLLLRGDVTHESETICYA